jgi:hypothetical protein
MFSNIDAISASEPDQGRSHHAKSRSPYSAIFKACDFPRGLDCVGVVHLAIAGSATGAVGPRAPDLLDGLGVEGRGQRLVRKPGNQLAKSIVGIG